MASSTALIAAESMNSSIAGRSRALTPSTASTADSTVAEGGHHHAGRVLRGQQSQRDFGDDAQRALTAHEQLRQAQPGDVLQSRTAEPDRGAVGQHYLHAQHVVGGDAVLHAAQAAGVGGDIAADAADLERRGVGRIPQAIFGNRLLHLGIEQAGLADGGTSDRVDADIAHLFRRQHDPVIQGRGPARQSAAGSPGHHGHPVCAGPAQDGLHLFGAARAHHRQRLACRRIESAVLPVTLGDGRIGDHHPVGQVGNEAGQRIRVHVPILRLTPLRKLWRAVQFAQRRQRAGHQADHHDGHRQRQEGGPQSGRVGQRAGHQ